MYLNHIVSRYLNLNVFIKISVIVKVKYLIIFTLTLMSLTKDSDIIKMT